MFYYLKGIISELEPNLAVIECSGVGFAVNITANTAGQLRIGETAQLFISEVVKEDAFDLYGFQSKQEQRFFNLLLSVSGIGPKAAVSILSSNTPDRLILAISSNDEKALTSVPGIGKKTAQRLMLELHDKVMKESQGTLSFNNSQAIIPAVKGNALNDAVAALSMLGYSSSDFGAILNSMDLSGMTTEQIIKAVLKHM